MNHWLSWHHPCILIPIVIRLALVQEMASYQKVDKLKIARTNTYENLYKLRRLQFTKLFTISLKQNTSKYYVQMTIIYVFFYIYFKKETISNNLQNCEIVNCYTGSHLDKSWMKQFNLMSNPFMLHADTGDCMREHTCLGMYMFK